MAKKSRYAGRVAVRKYEVTDHQGFRQVIEANYMFVNDGVLIFRRRKDDDPIQRAVVVASYAPGFWASFREYLND